MLPKNQTFAMAVTAGLFAAGMVFAAPVIAAQSDTAPQTAQVNPAPRAPRMAGDPVEMRIKELHDKLQITDAQSAQWNEVAQTMRDNAKAHRQIIEDAQKTEKTMTAVDDLKIYAQLAEAHAEGVKKLADQFEALYGQLSDAQKKVADDAFREHRHAALRRARTESKGQ
jgi:Spy/CpxP family protein refolding chaperone